jgi:hypothetical protein
MNCTGKKIIEAASETGQENFVVVALKKIVKNNMKVYFGLSPIR